MRKYKAPLSSKDNAAILDLIETGSRLEDVVEPALVQPIKNWLRICRPEPKTPPIEWLDV